jgi:SAM-dependent methyltransferase
MQKEFYYDDEPEGKMWDNMWTARTIEQELEACDIETPPRELFLQYLTKKDKIVEAGCGFAKWVIYLHRRGFDILGIDNNEFAISKLKEFDNSLQVEVGDILNIQYPDNFFDAYISMGVIEHFEEGPLAALHEAYRLVKPGGLIFVSVPTVNSIRKFYPRSVRKSVNSFLGSLVNLKSEWKKSKTKALLAPIVKPLPEKVKKILAGKKRRYFHFEEYRYTRYELENFLKETGFKIIETLPHDFYESEDHSVGVWMDFPFLRDLKRGANARLNPLGKLISRILDSISPWIACANVICVARSLKKDNTN